MKKIKLILIVLGLMILLPFTVKAEETYSITAKVEKMGTTEASFTLTLNGYDASDGSEYYVYLCNENDPAPAKPTSVLDINDSGVVEGWHVVSKSQNGEIFVDKTWYAYKDASTAYVLKRTFGTPDVYELSSAIKIDKPAKFANGTGYHFNIGDKKSLFKNNSEIWALFPFIDREEYKFSVKVGTVSDRTLINKLVNKTTDSYESLMSYAKNDTKGKKITGIREGMYGAFSPNIDKIVEGVNYYVLIESESSKLRNLTDVYIRTGSSIGTLSDFSDKGDTSEYTGSSKSEPNPNTMDKNVLVNVLGLLGISLALIISYKKLKEVK